MTSLHKQKETVKGQNNKKKVYLSKAILFTFPPLIYVEFSGKGAASQLWQWLANIYYKQKKKSFD